MAMPRPASLDLFVVSWISQLYYILDPWYASLILWLMQDLLHLDYPPQTILSPMSYGCVSVWLLPRFADRFLGTLALCTFRSSTARPCRPHLAVMQSPPNQTMLLTWNVVYNTVAKFSVHDNNISNYPCNVVGVCPMGWSSCCSYGVWWPSFSCWRYLQPFR